MQNLSPQLQLMIKFETEQNALKSRVTELERRIEDITAPEPEPERLAFTDEPKRWSEREIEYLRRAYSLGQTDVEIAAELGRTLGSIKSNLVRRPTSAQGGRKWTTSALNSILTRVTTPAR